VASLREAEKNALVTYGNLCETAKGWCAAAAAYVEAALATGAMPEINAGLDSAL
jgi:hypothetical protein